MGITAALIAGAIIVIVLLTVAPSLVMGLVDQAGNFYTATQLQPRPDVTETICDLRITTDVDLTQDINLGILLIDSKPEFTVNDIDYQWFDCYKTNVFPAAALVNFNHMHGLTELSFLTAVEGSVTGKIKLIDSSDSSQQVDWNLQQQLKKTVNFPAGTYSTPLPVDQTFVVTNIPVRNYDIELYLEGFFFGSKFELVNDKIEPYKDQIESFE